ncbi:MAG: immunoglobulin-like domain-containing protein [Lachnospiraceae bacterium]
MKEKIVIFLLSVMCVFFLGFNFFAGINMDRTEPVIQYDTDKVITYTEGEDQEELLKDVSVTDDSDRDVSESLRISELYKTGDHKGIVVYVAKDQANNIAKVSREIEYKEQKSLINDEINDITEDHPMDPNDEDVPEDHPSDEPQTEGKGPYIGLLAHEATISVGETFNIVRYVERAVDGEGGDISRSIHIDGIYDINTPGTYQLGIYALDSAGNKSNVEQFILYVQ